MSSAQTAEKTVHPSCKRILAKATERPGRAPTAQRYAMKGGVAHTHTHPYDANADDVTVAGPTVQHPPCHDGLRDRKKWQRHWTCNGSRARSGADPADLAGRRPNLWTQLGALGADALLQCAQVSSDLSQVRVVRMRRDTLSFRSRVAQVGEESVAERLCGGDPRTRVWREQAAQQGEETRGSAREALLEFRCGSRRQAGGQHGSSRHPVRADWDPLQVALRDDTYDSGYPPQHIQAMLAGEKSSSSQQLRLYATC